MDEELLLIEFKKGNQNAFGKLYQTYYKRFVVYAKHYVEDIQIAENLTQDVFVKVYEAKRKVSNSYFFQSLYVYINSESLFELFKKRKTAYVN